jgi:hypothetical protein
MKAPLCLFGVLRAAGCGIVGVRAGQSQHLLTNYL